MLAEALRGTLPYRPLAAGARVRHCSQRFVQEFSFCYAAQSHHLRPKSLHAATACGN